MPHLPGLAFDLGETIDMLRDTVQQFAAAEIAPRAADDRPRQPLSLPTSGPSSARSACTA